MKKRAVKMISMALAAGLLAGCLGGCGKEGEKNSDGGNAQVVDQKDGDNSDSASGAGGTGGGDGQQVTVQLLVPTDNVDEINTIIPIFEQMHQDIKVELVPSAVTSGETANEVSKLAAAERLVDVAFGSENFGYILSQGLAYPLDKLYAEDPDKEYALQAGINNYTYGGHLYALPWRIQFNGLLVNVDLFETGNLNKPEYDWTIEEYISLAKGITDNQYSGINYMINPGDPTHGFDTKLMGGMLSAPEQLYGYNMETHQFDFTSGAWVKAKEYVRELQSVPGLVSDELKEEEKRNQGIADAYDNKFGGSADALVAGKVLFGNHNTWETYWMDENLNFQWDIYPVPHAADVEQRIQTHLDYVFMTSAVTEEKRQAAYELVKFLSYSKEGCIARLDWTGENLNPAPIYTPASSDPEVLEYYAGQDYIRDGMKYMLNTISENPEKIFIADANKLIPNFWNDVTQYREQIEKQISEGGDPNALAADFENKVNAAASATWSSFESKLEKFITEFYETHPYEKM